MDVYCFACRATHAPGHCPDRAHGELVEVLKRNNVDSYSQLTAVRGSLREMSESTATALDGMSSDVTSAIEQLGFRFTIAHERLLARTDAILETLEAILQAVTFPRQTEVDELVGRVEAALDTDRPDRWQRAKKYLLQAFEINDLDYRTNLYLGQVFHQEGDFGTSAKYFGDAARIVTQKGLERLRSGAFLLASRAHLRSGNIRGALEAVDLARKADSQDGAVDYQEATILAVERQEGRNLGDVLTEAIDKEPLYYPLAVVDGAFGDQRAAVDVILERVFEAAWKELERMLERGRSHLSAFDETLSSSSSIRDAAVGQSRGVLREAQSAYQRTIPASASMDLGYLSIVEILGEMRHKEAEAVSAALAVVSSSAAVLHKRGIPSCDVDRRDRACPDTRNEEKCRSLGEEYERSLDALSSMVRDGGAGAIETVVGHLTKSVRLHTDLRQIQEDCELESKKAVAGDHEDTRAFLTGMFAANMFTGTLFSFVLTTPFLFARDLQLSMSSEAAQFLGAGYLLLMLVPLAVIGFEFASGMMDEAMEAFSSVPCCGCLVALVVLTTVGGGCVALIAEGMPLYALAVSGVLYLILGLLVTVSFLRNVKETARYVAVATTKDEGKRRAAESQFKRMRLYPILYVILSAVIVLTTILNPVL